MKRMSSLLLTVLLALNCVGQQYSFTFKLDGSADTMLYIAQHYRDEIKLVDSARLASGQYVFKGKRTWDKGIYALVKQDRKSQVGDFAIDNSRRFTIAADAKLTPSTVKVQGCPSNQEMFTYLATIQQGQQEIKEIRERKKDPATKEKAEAEEKALIDRMVAYEASTRTSSNIFMQLVTACENPEVPDSIKDPAYYYRTHYWDHLFATHTAMTRELLHSPQLFNKMNYFFFGILYHADSDTIIKEIDRLMARIGNDTAMARYVMQFIEPRYYRSTKNIGWDAVWCHIAHDYMMTGRFPWAKESELYLAKKNYHRIVQSIIGAHGQELWMADTNQSDNPADWISSHRFPEKYVILWFWDPDCHHCQEQSAALKVLYDSLLTAPDRRFEVYAIGYESDVPKWKKYVKEHDFRWVNVGGPNVNIDYQEAYNVHSAPTMIILNERRDIIMNKVLPAKMLLQFLDNYEKKQK